MTCRIVTIGKKAAQQKHCHHDNLEARQCGKNTVLDVVPSPWQLERKSPQWR
jgi:hypothetical protein